MAAIYLGDAGRVVAEQVSLKVRAPVRVHDRHMVDSGHVHFKIRRNTALKKLTDAYCERRGYRRSALRFFFKDNQINEHKTPDNLNMKDGDIIDALFTPPIYFYAVDDENAIDIENAVDVDAMTEGEPDEGQDDAAALRALRRLYADVHADQERGDLDVRLGGGAVCKAHRLIVEKRCGYVARLLTTGARMHPEPLMLDLRSLVPGLSDEAGKAAILFMYTEELQVGGLSTTDFVQLCVAADMLDVAGLAPAAVAALDRALRRRPAAAFGALAALPAAPAPRAEHLLRAAQCCLRHIRDTGPTPGAVASLKWLTNERHMLAVPATAAMHGLHFDELIWPAVPDGVGAATGGGGGGEMGSPAAKRARHDGRQEVRI